MKLSSWYPSLVSWLTDQTPITDWTLNPPERPGSVTGLVPPFGNFAIASNEYNQLAASLDQEICVSLCYPRDLTYRQLPMPAIQALYGQIAAGLVGNWSEINRGLTGSEWVEVGNPITIVRAGSEREHWVIELLWRFRVTFNLELESGSLVDPINVREINFGLWKSAIASDFDQNVLDFQENVLTLAD